MIFKKGSIIPRWVGVTTKDRKCQHLIKFGADVEVTPSNGACKIKLIGDGSAIMIKGEIRRKMKNGSRKKSSLSTGRVQITSRSIGISMSKS